MGASSRARKTPAQGAATSIWCAVSPRLEGMGGLLRGRGHRGGGAGGFQGAAGGAAVDTGSRPRRGALVADRAVDRDALRGVRRSQAAERVRKKPQAASARL
jgi:hypothetical protein